VSADHSEELAALVGRRSGAPQVAPDAVNLAMIRHWVEAMGDENPVYLSEEAATDAGFGGIVAPPTMLQAWIMRGLKASLEAESRRAEPETTAGSDNDRMMALLDDEGRTSVVATNCDQHYVRPLRLGERLVTTSTIEDITAEKKTGLGEGRFVTTRIDFVSLPDLGEHASVSEEVVAAGEPVATMRFRILKYRPGTAKGAEVRDGDGGPARPRRPRPAITQDNAFFFEGTRAGKLLIQRCVSCHTLRHPPLPACAVCGSLDWDTVQASGRGELYSFVVVHYPKVPSFDYPLPIGLVALEEGTRLVADLAIDPAELRIGMPVEAELVSFDDELTLPVFHGLPAERDEGG